LASEGTIRRSEAGALALEIAWLRAAELPKLIAIERLLAGESTGEAAPAGPRRIASETAPRRGAADETIAAPPAPRPAARPNAAPPVAAAPPAAAPSETAPRPRLVPKPGEEVEAFLEEVSRRKANLAGLVQGLATLSYRADERALCLQPHDAFAAGSLARANNRELLEAAAAAVLGGGTSVRVLPPRPADKTPAPAEVATEAARAQVRDHPLVQSVLSVFGGEVAEVRRPEDEGEEEKR
jgi:hypothetical protein